MKIKLSVYTDSEIESFSKGEVSVFGLYNHRFKYPIPVQGGLYCQRIFGPIMDYTCACGKAMVTRSKPCNECGVAPNPSSVRRDRFGHLITLPYVNPYMVRPMGKLLGIRHNILTNFLVGSYKATLVRDLDNLPDNSIVSREFLSLDGYSFWIILEDIKKLEDAEDSQLGILAIMQYMEDNNLDYQSLLGEVDIPMFSDPSKGYDDFDSLVNRKILVSPPTTRDMTVYDGEISYGDATYWYLYIMRSYSRAMSVDNEETILVREALITQKMVNSLISEGGQNYRGQDISSISSTLSGKTGRVRGDILGKRVDFSGRSVVSAGPHLPFDTLGVPFDMVYELLKPHITGKLERCLVDVEDWLFNHEMDNWSSIKSRVKPDEIKRAVEPFLDRGVLTKSATIKAADKLYKSRHELAKIFCLEAAEEEIIIMNRAPSLHRYSVMVFKIQVHFGKNIQVPNSIVGPFNMDFDGDTAGLHLVLTKKAKEEAIELLSIQNNILSSRDRDFPNINPTHEAAFGLYYGTQPRRLNVSSNPKSYEEVKKDLIAIVESLDLVPAPVDEDEDY